MISTGEKNMLKMYAALVYIATGIIIWFLGLRYIPQKIMKKETYKNNNKLPQYVKFQN